MWFWWFIFACNLLIPAVLISGGRRMWKHRPQKINLVYGYRTERSMKNMDTWTFAHQYCGKLWWQMGWWMLAPCVLAMIPFYGHSETVVGIAGLIVMVIQLVVLMSSIVFTENALQRTFNEDGTRK